MNWTTYECMFATVVIAILSGMLAVVWHEATHPFEMVCVEPKVIAVTETATGVVVRCIDVEDEQ